MSSSAHMLLLPLDATSPPSRVTASCLRAMSTSFHIVWSKPDAEYAIELNWHHPAVETINGSVNAYILEYGESCSSAPPSSISLSGEVEEHTVTGLKPHTEYYVKVAAVNDAGRGPFCEPVLVQTVPDSEYWLFFLPANHFLSVMLVLFLLFLDLLKSAVWTGSMCPNHSAVQCPKYC